MVSVLYDRPFITAPMVTEVEPEIYVENICSIPKVKILESEEKERRERKKRKH